MRRAIDLPSLCTFRDAGVSGYTPGNIDHRQGSSVPSSPWLQCPQFLDLRRSISRGHYRPSFGQWIRK